MNAVTRSVAVLAVAAVLGGYVAAWMYGHRAWLEGILAVVSLYLIGVSLRMLNKK
jgi:hypothetical protein